MKHTLVLLTVAVAALAPALSGCAEDDWDREAAYPGSIGTSAPPHAATAQVSAASGEAPAVPQAQVVQGDESAEQGAPAPAADEYADNDPSALTDFRTTLDPYGNWVDDSTYGTVWVPSSSVVGDDFTPYQTAGHWVYDDDYTWVSDYDWGWAPFHYGRWVYAAPYGWEWIPGRVYSGAWVSWRYGYGDWGYVGWAPLAPYWGWRGGVAFGFGFVPAEPYGFCASGSLFAGRVSTVMVGGAQAGEIGAHTRPWVGANPSVGGRVAASPHVSGPPPNVMHIPAGVVAHGAMANRGIVQAQAFSHASTASSLGGRAPQGTAFSPRSTSAGRQGGYASNSPASSHFGGRLGSGFRGDIASQRPSYSGAYGGSASRSFGGGYSGASPYRGGYGGYTGGGFGARPSYGGGVVHPSSGHASGGYSGDGGYSGGHHVGGFSGGGSHGFGGFSGGGGGGFHGGGGSFGGGGGGFHGGGGGGGHGGGHR